MPRHRVRSVKNKTTWSEDDQAFWDKAFLESLDPEIEDVAERVCAAEEVADLAMFLRQEKHAGRRPFTCGPDDLPELEDVEEDA